MEGGRHRAASTVCRRKEGGKEKEKEKEKRKRKEKKERKRGEGKRKGGREKERGTGGIRNGGRELVPRLRWEATCAE